MSPADAHRRRFILLSSLRWVGTGCVIPTLVVLMQSRGLTLAQIGSSPMTSASPASTTKETRRRFGPAACSFAAASRPMKSFFSSMMKRSIEPSNGP